MIAKEIKNFTLAEMLVTNTGLPNFPSTLEQLENVLETAKRLQTVRNLFGRALRVNSVYRSRLVNEAVDGSKTSMHLQALAADICAYSGNESDNRDLYSLLESMMKEMQIDQLIMYNKKAGDKSSTIRFIHVGWTNVTPRGQKLFK